MEKIREGESQKREDAGSRKGRKVAKHCVFPNVDDDAPVYLWPLGIKSEPLFSFDIVIIDVQHPLMDITLKRIKIIYIYIYVHGCFHKWSTPIAGWFIGKSQ